jgi:Ca2+-binding RTX toxin-like protein
MCKSVLLLATMGLAVLLASGLALAAPKGGTTNTIQCSAGTTCYGTDGPDIIYGTDLADVIRALKGDDKIIPYAGDDQIFGDDGNDEVRHSFGKDYIEGGLGADTLRGGFGLDTIYGNQPSATNREADQSDGARDLIDCAYLKSRGDTGPDVGFGNAQDNDTVVDCSNIQ